MEPVVDLPPLAELRGRWAAAAAVVHALGFPAAAHARDRRCWQWEDGSGNWARVTVLDGGRAVLVGRDATVTRRLARRRDGEPTGELVADVPRWWSTALRDPSEEIGFVLGWDGAGWSRSAGVVPEGRLAGVPTDAERLYGVVDGFVEGVADDQGLGGWRTPWPAVERLGRAGPGLTVEHLAEVLGPLRADLPAGVVAARRFDDGSR